MYTLTELLNKFETIKKDIPTTVNLRSYRCLSWLKKADASTDDIDIKFISLWIAFNAVYAKDTGLASSDKSAFQNFIRLIERKAQKDLNKTLWTKHKKVINDLIDNKYIFQSFWDYQNKKISEVAWLDDFDHKQIQLRKAIEYRDSEKALIILFDRIYTLRNQIFHGGASYMSGANRSALLEVCYCLEDLILIFLGVILDNPNESLWGEPFYPYLVNNF